MGPPNAWPENEGLSMRNFKWKFETHAIEFEFVKNNVRYIREKEYAVQYKGTVLKHKYFADFVVEDNIILEIKSKGLFADEDFAQTINYLKCSGCKVGIVLNFGSKKLGIKRIVNWIGVPQSR